MALLKQQPRSTKATAPASRMAEPRRTWPRDGFLCFVSTIVGAGAATSYGKPALAAAVVGLGLLLTAATCVFGARAYSRALLTAKVVEGLAPLLGLPRPDPRAVKVARWRATEHSRWIGAPTRINARFSSTLIDDDPGFRPRVLDMCQRRLHANYEVHRHDSGRCRIKLRLVVMDGSATQQIENRAKKAAADLLGASARIPNLSWSDDGDLTGFTISHSIGTKVSANRGYKRRIEATMSAMLPGRWGAEWSDETDSVEFKLRPELPDSVLHPKPRLDGDYLYKIPLAVDENGELIYFDLLKASHLLGSGKTGTGKTVMLDTLITELCFRKWEVFIADPKRIEFLGYRNWPNVRMVATTVGDQVALIHHMWKLMQERYEMIEEEGAHEDDFEPVFFLFDEYREFLGDLKQWWASIKVSGMPAVCPAIEWFGSIARKGRSARVHLCVGLQRADAEFLTGEMRDNFVQRISLGRLSPQGAQMMWEENWPLATTVPTRRPGRGTAPSLKNPDQPCEVQVLWTPDPRRARKAEDLALLEMLRPATVTHERLRVKPNAEYLDSKTGVWDSIFHAELVPASDIEISIPIARTPQVEPDEVDLIVIADDDGDLVDPLDALYGEQDRVRVGDVEVGDLVLDESTGTWGVAEFVIEDVAAEGYICVDWRSEEGHTDSLSIPDSDYIDIRRPIESADESEGETWRM